jgi:tripartite ATP-independent transporter DctP family solute receptor
MPTRREFLRRAGAAIAAAAAARPAYAQYRQVLKAADRHPIVHPTVEAIARMGRKLEQATESRLLVRVLAAVPEGEAELLRQTQVGTLQICRVSLGSVSTLVEELNALTLPFVFRDELHMRRVIDGPVGADLLDKITGAQGSRLVGLGWMDAGPRHVYAKKAFRTPGDLKGQRIRVMDGTPIAVDTMNAMGGDAVRLDVNELYGALQSGVVAGAESNVPTLLAHDHYQITKIFSLTGHVIAPDLFVFSRRTWDGLAAEEQAALKKLARQAQAEQRQLWETLVSESTLRLKAAGVEFVAIDTAAFREATGPVRDRYAARWPQLLERIEYTR